MPRKLMYYKEAREKAGIKFQAEMARRMGMQKASYSLKENYDQQFKADELMVFCDITGVDQKDLYILGYNYK